MHYKVRFIYTFEILEDNFIKGLKPKWPHLYCYKLTVESAFQCLQRTTNSCGLNFIKPMHKNVSLTRTKIINMKGDL